jgi:hypothetical protein
MKENHGKTNGMARQRAIVLQDRKRLPGRFFACLSGALTCRIG